MRRRLGASEFSWKSAQQTVAAAILYIPSFPFSFPNFQRLVTGARSELSHLTGPGCLPCSVAPASIASKAQKQMLAWRGGQQRLLQLSQKKRKAAGKTPQLLSSIGGAGANLSEAAAAWLPAASPQAGSGSQKPRRATEQQPEPAVPRGQPGAHAPAAAAAVPSAAPTNHHLEQARHHKRIKRSLDLAALEMPDWAPSRDGSGGRLALASQTKKGLPSELQQAAQPSPSAGTVPF